MSAGAVSGISTSTAKPFSPKEAVQVFVDEISEDDFLEIKDMITVYGKGQVNINTCSKEILEILDIKQNTINALLDFRAGSDRKPGTPDDGRFDSKESVLETFVERYRIPLKGEQSLALLFNKHLLGVSSDNYRINIIVNDNAGRLVDKYSVVIGKKDNKAELIIKEWNRV